MISRRDFLQTAAAVAAATGLGGQLSRVAAQQAVRQEDLLAFAPKGQLTILHMADSHAQLKPLYFREPSVNIGVGEARGQLPHLTDRELLAKFDIPAGSHQAYMLSSADYEALARTYGRVGGMDRMATVVKAVRAERGAERVLLLDGGDTLQGSYTALQSKGGDMAAVMRQLGVEATTGHWEFTLGADRVSELFGGVGQAGSAGVPFLAGNVRDTDFDDPIFDGHAPVREGRRQHRRDRPGLPLHADRQSALDDAALDLRHARGRRAPDRGQCARGWAPRWSCCCRTTASTSTARWRGASRASTSSSPRTRTMRCPRRSRSAARC